MKTTTNIISSASLTAAAEDEFTGAVAVDLNGVTPTNNDAVLKFTITNGSTLQPSINKVIVSIAFNSSDVHTSPAQLKASVVQYPIAIPNAASAVSIIHTDKLTVKNRWVHAWYQHEPLAGPCNLALDIVT